MEAPQHGNMHVALVPMLEFFFRLGTSIDGSFSGGGTLKTSSFLPTQTTRFCHFCRQHGQRLPKTHLTYQSNDCLVSHCSPPPEAWHVPPAWMGTMFLAFLFGFLTPVISTDITLPPLTSCLPRMKSKVEVPVHQQRQLFPLLFVTALALVLHSRQRVSPQRSLPGPAPAPNLGPLHL